MWSPTGKPVVPFRTPVGRNPEQEPRAKAGARVEGSRAIRRRTYRRPGRLVPPGAVGLRARAVRLMPGQQMDWHSTRAREELLVALRGSLRLEVQDARRRIRLTPLRAGQCAFVPSQTVHRIINRSRAQADYIYITAPAR